MISENGGTLLLEEVRISSSDKDYWTSALPKLTVADVESGLLTLTVILWKIFDNSSILFVNWKLCYSCGKIRIVRLELLVVSSKTQDSSEWDKACGLGSIMQIFKTLDIYEHKEYTWVSISSLCTFTVSWFMGKKQVLLLLMGWKQSYYMLKKGFRTILMERLLHGLTKIHQSNTDYILKTQFDQFQMHSALCTVLCQ